MSNVKSNSSKEPPVLLIIGLVWPEPEATAAGTRMLQLIHLFRSWHYQIHFASVAEKGPYAYPLEKENVICHDIQLNSDSFNHQLTEIRPEIVVFDRFISEEQFGWRVREVCPETVCILDTEDLHFLRHARKLAMKTGTNQEQHLINDTTKREVASMYRCDLSLIISAYEYKLLVDQFDFPESHLLNLPFLPDYYSRSKDAKPPSFEERSDFMFLGNGKHAPNIDAINFLKEQLWPEIRKKLPQAQLHIYGAYLPVSINRLHHKKDGFLIEGWVENKTEAYFKHRVFLSPLRFGAGLKGKSIDCKAYGLPSVASHLTAEGFELDEHWNGYLETDTRSFVNKAVLLYSNEHEWYLARDKGFKSFDQLLNSERSVSAFLEKLKGIVGSLEIHRRKNFVGSMLQHHSLQSTRYLSKWIQAKNS